MSSLAKNLKTLAAVVGFAAAGVATGAQAQTTPNQCGITGSAGVATSIVYDPFNPTGLQDAIVTIPLTRENYTGGGDTRIVNFYLKEVNGRADGTKIYPTSVTGAVNVDGIGLNIFYGSSDNPPYIMPIDVLPSTTNRFLKINFTGNNAGSDTAQATFRITLPPLADLEAVRELAFDAHFSCNIQGGKFNGAYDADGYIPNAIKFPIKILSALRASYQGTALDFGEIGQVTTAQAQTHVISNNYVRVESSGAYSVEMKSDNGYLLKKPDATTPLDQIGYKIKFLGQERSFTSGPNIPITKTCSRAGLDGAKSLAIEATLMEGGEGKNPSDTYSDYLTVTLTPLIYGATGGTCA